MLLTARQLTLYPAPPIDGLLPPTEEALRSKLEENASDWLVRFALGNFLYRQARYEEAEEQLTAALKLHSQAEIAANLACCRVLLGKSDEAVKSFQHALEINARLDQTSLSLARLLRVLGRTNEAQRILRELALRSPLRGVAYEELAFIAELDADIERAKEYWQLAYQHDPERIPARDRLCEALLSVAEEAQQSGDQLALLRTLGQASHLYRSSLIQNQSNAQKLREILKRISMDYDSSRALATFRSTYDTEGTSNLKSLFSQFLLAIGIFPEHYEDDLVEDPREYWKSNLRRLGEHPFPHFRLGLLDCLDGNLEEALRELDFCLEKMPPKKHRQLRVETIHSFVRDILSIIREQSPTGDVISEESWESQGFTERFEQELWKKSGFTPSEARSWKDAQFAAAEAALWKKSGTGSSDAAAWKKAGFTEAKKAGRFYRAGFTPHVAQVWERDFPMDTGEIISWHRAGFLDPREAREWADVFTVPFEAWSWREQGFSPLESKTLRSQGVYDPFQARRLQEQPLEETPIVSEDEKNT